MICGHGHEQKFKYPDPWDSEIIKMPYPRAKTIDQITALCPLPAPEDRCSEIIFVSTDDLNAMQK